MRSSALAALSSAYGCAAMVAACASYCTFVVAEDGTLFAWGKGDYGQLGLGDQEHRRQPALVGSGDAPCKVVVVAASGSHLAAATEDGALWTCGAGGAGQLGHGDGAMRSRPVRLGLEVFGGSPVVLVACGQSHTLAVTGGGRVATCGINSGGQLGHGNRTSTQVFALVDAQQLWGARIVMAACGYNHSVAVTAEGDVFTWGSGAHGRLGHNDEQDRLGPARLAREQFGGGHVVLVAGGSAHTVALTAGGLLWVWGCAVHGQLGLGDASHRLVPTRLGAREVFGGSLVRMAACGGWHTLAVTDDGGAWTWGNGTFGELGLGSNVVDNALDVAVPLRVPWQFFAGARVATVSGGHCHSAAVTEGGALYTWGRGEVAAYARSQVPGGLGHADLRDRLEPTLVSQCLLGGARVGRWHGLAEEHILAFAMGTHARLGAGAGGSAGEDKPCPYLMLQEELVQRVVEACRWDAAKAGEGVARLVGGWTEA